MPERLVYEVIKSFQGARAWQPGDLITDYENWPFGRAERLIDQRLIRPVTITVDEEHVEGSLALEDMNNAQLRAFAEARDIDLTGHLRSNQTIIDRIRGVEEA